MAQRRLVPTAPSLLGAVALAVLVAACGGRVQRDLSDCNADAVAYCTATGCPLTGPATSTPGAVRTWCSGSAFAPQVTGYGTCTTPDGQPWATDVRATDAAGGVLYLLYDPATGKLLSASTVPAGNVGGGAGETDYGTCAQGTGIVSCATTAFTCAR